MANLNIDGILKATGGGEELLDVNLITDIGEDYIQYNNGIQICWGYSSGDNTSTITVNFPKPFINSKPLSITTGSKGSSYSTTWEHAAILSNIVNTFGGSYDLGFTWQKNDNFNLYWKAIGYWK